MSWIGKIVGGAIGGMVGGPVGLAIGAGLGHAYDASDGLPGLVGEGGSLGVDGSFEDDGLGHLVLLTFPPALPANATVVAVLHDATGSPVLAPPPWSDDNGEFAVVTQVLAGEALLYVPYAALTYATAGAASLQIATLLPDPRAGAGAGVQNAGVLGFDTLELPLPAARPPGGRIAVLQPLIDLGMAVARADGKVERQEIRLLKEFFRGSFDVTTKTELNQLRDAIKAADTSDPAASVRAVFRRLPSLTASDLLAFLASVARSDDHVDSAEIAVIRQFATAPAATKKGTEAALADLDLTAQDAPHVVLGVSRNATPEEIKAAYRDLMKAYHPDRVATLPAEFQELAHDKSQEIAAAYKALTN